MRLACFLQSMSEWSYTGVGSTYVLFEMQLATHRSNGSVGGTQMAWPTAWHSRKQASLL